MIGALRLIAGRVRAHARADGWPAALGFAIRLLWQKLRDVGWTRAFRQFRALDGRQTGADNYSVWIDRHLPSSTRIDQLRREQAGWAWRPVVSIVTPVYNTPPEWLERLVVSVERQAYPLWELCLADDASTDPGTARALDAIAARAKKDPRIKITRAAVNGGISAASNLALGLGTGELVALLDHDDELSADALAEAVRRFNERPATDIVYSDEDKLELDGRHSEPYFKPDWAPEHFMGTMYTCHLTVMRRALVEKVGSFRLGYEGAQDYDLWLRAMERTDKIEHIARILYHWRKIPGSTAAVSAAKTWALDAGARAIADAVRRRGVSADVVPGLLAGNYRVKYHVPDSARLSILVPTRGAAAAASDAGLKAAGCLRTVVEHSRHRAPEFILVTDDGTLPDTVAAVFDGVPHTVLSDPGPFNFSRRMNLAAAAASHDTLLLLNDDVEARSSDWLDAMLEYALQPGIGVVGPRLDDAEGRIQHIGMILGVRGLAAHAFHRAPHESGGHFGSSLGPRNYSAVTGACLMTPRAVWQAAGGMDEALAVDFNDLDYCLKVRARGLRVVFTPFAWMVHHESVTAGPRVPGAADTRLISERWAAVIARDPYYNENLTKDFQDYRVTE